MSKKTVKASDVFHAQQPFFGKKATFSEAFPTVDKLHVDVQESGSGVRPGFSHRGYDSATAHEYLDCRNSRCHNGGVKLGDVLRSLVDSESTTSETTHFCQGYEGSPRSKQLARQCDHSFKVTVTISYKPNRSEATKLK